jgi:hypothetical protein
MGKCPSLSPILEKEKRKKEKKKETGRASQMDQMGVCDQPCGLKGSSPVDLSAGKPDKIPLTHGTGSGSRT